MSSWLSLACSGLMYSSVPTTWPKLVNMRPLGQLLADGLGHAEVDDLGDRAIVVVGHQDVGGLQVAVDDPLLMGVLDGLANGDEQLQPLRGVRRCSSQYWVIGTPLTSSMTK